MSGRTLKIALAASVALNLFALGGGAAFLISRAKVDERIAEQRRPGREGGFPQLISRLSPEARREVRTSMRAVALSARPDFEAAREARRQAVEAAKQPQMDPVRVQALLDQSRTAELRGRARLEGGTIAMLQKLDVQDRAALAELLARKGPGGAGRNGRTAEPPPPLDAPPPP
ncbi:hypothetical protein GCM10017620_03700 [Brevundimonas intermedia]|uniref:Periplasmic heavy metal sensor n=1 Tax=Brevundimonas intermedia TaxID=74315 RepID=A0ABQ5T5E8_9CAUL|nr:periplasmic heavy metal sensor [Brevundimonas intermedia]GLK47397.1 hypothetical protein GCM10017620_03700 [Brevundimonas intermedia]